MLYNYEIVNNGKEEILYLYLDMKYEFSNELSFKDEKDLSRRAKNFINTNHINFHGKKVFLIVDGIVVKTLDISKAEIDRKTYQFSCETFMVNVSFDDGSLCEVSLREYLLSVLMSKYMVTLHDEVLKAMCVLYNTYAYKEMNERHVLLSNSSFAIYKPISYYKAVDSHYDLTVNRLNRIIHEVDCLFLSYKNEYILPFIHFSNAGRTLSNIHYPYLTSVKSLWDLTSPYYINVDDFSYDQLQNILSISIDSTSLISIVFENGVKKIKINDYLYTIEEVRTMFDLKSSDIYFIVYHDFLRIITLGWGNAYGMSIFGANEIAKNGGKYYNILSYYFPSTKLYRNIKELSF